MITTTGKKEYYKPYATDGKTSVVMWDYSPILNDKGEEINAGRWKIEYFDKQLSLNEIKDFILTYYNSKIDEKIISGMVWNGRKIWLSSENQFNYKAAYDLAVQTNGSNLPVVFKFGDTNNPDYYGFDTIEELSDFYISSVKYIQNTLLEGWKKKDSIDWSVYDIF